MKRAIFFATMLSLQYLFAVTADIQDESTTVALSPSPRATYAPTASDPRIIAARNGVSANSALGPIPCLPITIPVIVEQPATGLRRVAQQCANGLRTTAGGCLYILVCCWFCRKITTYLIVESLQCCCEECEQNI